ncbi:MAG: hypothetical protein OSA43_05155 [Pirellulales bacterium]|nr:hypothetical protein [Pirellulales bacterium]
MASKVTTSKKKSPQSDEASKVKKKKAASAKTAATKKAGAKKTATKKTATKKTATKKTATKKKETKKAEKKPKAKRASRKKVVAEVRLKAYWGVFNQSLKRVALYEYNQKRQADKRAVELTGKSSSPHFVQLVKEVFEAD